MRAIAIAVALLATVEFTLVGADAVFWHAPDEIARAALAGIVAGAIGLVASITLWRRSSWAVFWLIVWGIASGFFILLMPVLALRHSAPEGQFGRSVVVAALFGCSLALVVWRTHRALRSIGSSDSSPVGADSNASQQRHN